MRAPGFNGHGQQRGHLCGTAFAGASQRELPQHLHQTDRAHALRIVRIGDTHPAFAVGQQIFVQGPVEHFELGRPLAFDQRQVAFAHAALAQLLLQQAQHAAFFGHQQNPAGFAV